MMKEFITTLSGSVPLRRKGARLSSALGSWQMMNVYGPLSLGNEAEESRQFFRIETASRETLLVYRKEGERGMRELFLYEVVPGKPVASPMSESRAS